MSFMFFKRRWCCGVRRRLYDYIIVLSVEHCLRRIGRGEKEKGKQLYRMLEKKVNAFFQIQNKKMCLPT